jgi:mono/diheme cytochrome c family protein
LAAVNLRIPSSAALRRIGARGLWLAALLCAGAAGWTPGVQAAATATAVAKLDGPESLSASERASQARAVQSARFWRHDGMSPAEASPGAPALSADPALIEMGRRIYQEGVRADGKALVGQRLGGQVRIAGPAAACVLCHRPSGLGGVEGPNQISPITGRYLFDQDRRAIANMYLRANKSFNQRHEPYTLESLTQALRSGRHESGRQMDELMPRYELSDTEVLAVASYLRRLSNAWSPGVSDKAVAFATIITPDVDAERKRIFLNTLQGIVAQKNGNLLHGQRTMSSGAEMVLQTDRRWELQVWELQGAPETWQAQLESFQAAKPVFAVASGLGAGNWGPVHRFCELQKLPCWFPVIGTAPAESQSGFYSLYFSRGAALEADVLAMQLLQADASTGASGAAGKRRVLQVYADPGVAETAVAGLRQRLAGSSLQNSELRLPGGGADGPALAQALAGLGPTDHVVFWLTSVQLGLLNDLTPPAAKVYVSASLGGGDRLPLTAPWRAEARVLYPYQLPALRQRGLVVFKEFLRVRKLALEDEVLQSEVYFALAYLNDTLVDMLDNVHRDYLVERGESMLSLRENARAEDEARDLSLPKSNLIDHRTVKPLREMSVRPIIPRAVPNATPARRENGEETAAPTPRGMGMLAPAAVAARAMAAEGAGHGKSPSETDGSSSRMSGAPSSTNVYPRLSLGQRQRFASKGAYVVRLSADGMGALRAESDWIIP